MNASEMLIFKSDRFKSSLSAILHHISRDSKNRAKQFNGTLKTSLSSLPNMPYKFRQSVYFEDESIRDYIFMGYCIPYLIQSEKNRIVLLDIIKWKQG